jgi:hypothetical protein
MITPISRVHPAEAQQPSRPAAPKPDPQMQTPKSGDLSHDQVTLKSAGQPEHDSKGQ